MPPKGPQSDIVERAEKYLSQFVPDLWRGDCEEMLAEAIEELKAYYHLREVIAEAIPCLTIHGDCDRCGTRMKARCDAITEIAQGRVRKQTKLVLDKTIQGEKDPQVMRW